MRLHEDTDVFSEMIAVTADAFRLPQVYVEKDYWITRALKNLSASPYAQDSVFKGGTSLSKAHRLIHRFSEDIDLAVLAKGYGDSRRRNLLKSIEKAASKDLVRVEDERTSKGSNYRKTVYQYPRHVGSEDFGQASQELLIEVNTFSSPEPIERKAIQTLIAEILLRRKEQGLIDQFELTSFDLVVL